MNSRLLCGDALEQLRLLPDGSVQCCITSPPYWALRDYGIAGQLGLERTPEEYVAKLIEVFREVRRVLRADGTLWLNLGDCYQSGDRGRHRKDSHRWENCPMQSKATGSHLEAVSPNRLPQVGLKDKDLVGVPWMVAFALRSDGWWLRRDIIWNKLNPMPESAKDRPTSSHEYLFLLTKSARYYYDGEAIREPDTGNLHDQTRKTRAADGQKRAPTKLISGIRAAQKLDVDPDRRRRGFNDRWDAAERRSKMPDGWATHGGGHGSFHKDGREAGASSVIRPGRNKRSVWTIPTQPFPEAHFATFPEALVEPCIAAGSRPGDTVLDPFCGSGTVGVVALRAGRDAILIDLKPEYVEMARRRIRRANPLFAQVEGQ